MLMAPGSPSMIKHKDPAEAKKKANEKKRQKRKRCELEYLCYSFHGYHGKLWTGGVGNGC